MRGQCEDLETGGDSATLWRDSHWVVSASDGPTLARLDHDVVINVLVAFSLALLH